MIVRILIRIFWGLYVWLIFISQCIILNLIVSRSSKIIICFFISFEFVFLCLLSLCWEWGLNLCTLAAGGMGTLPWDGGTVALPCLWLMLGRGLWWCLISRAIFLHVLHTQQVDGYPWYKSNWMLALGAKGAVCVGQGLMAFWVFKGY